jgi:phage N-6-adenine-methyltransferase
MSPKTHNDNIIGWPAGVKREEYAAWKTAQEAKGVTENVNPQEYKRQRDLGLVASVPAREPVTAVVPAAPAIEATVVPFTEPEGPLIPDEQRRFAELEHLIEQNMQGFMRVGLALLEISRLKFFREDYDSFEDYLEERWGFGERQGYFMIEAAEVATNIQQLAPGCPLPTAPRQLRGMGELSPEDQVAVWKDACSRIGGDLVPPARVVKEALDDYRAKMPPPEESGKRRRGRPLKSEQAAKEEEAPKKPNNEWYTPERYIDAVTDVLGTIYLDPASCDEAQEVVKANRYYTADDDGLEQSWHASTIYLNPPYESRLVGRFVSRLLKAYADNECDEAVLLVNAQTGSPWFQRLYGELMCFVDHRISFRRPAAVETTDEELEAELDEDEELDGQGDAAPAKKKGAVNGFLYSVFVYLGDDPNAFIDRFKEFGPVGRFERFDLPDDDELLEAAGT